MIENCIVLSYASLAIYLISKCPGNMQHSTVKPSEQNSHR
jgi:hypothetical protein